jgi:formamidase
MAHRIAIDRGKRLADEPHVGHNRYHPDIEPVVEVGEGEEVVLETRDALDGQIRPGGTVDDFANIEAGAIHPLTGPVYVKGAQPGDGLEIEFLDIGTEPVGFSLILPGMGFLRDVMTTPFLVHWDIRDGWATSSELPGVRIPGAPFMGVSAVAPSADALRAWTEREARLIERGGTALAPDPDGAVPGGTCGLAGLRTLPPRENGGNFDVKQLTRGAKLVLPVFVEGGLFSTGDGHFAQGDGEVCVTAVEVGATAAVRFRVLQGAFAERRFRAPVFTREDYFIDPRFAAPQRFLGVMGIPVDDEGENRGEDLTLACRNALLNMIDLLQERGYSREQAYVICSVAVDLRISNVVDVPNYVVSALLPEAIFDSEA